MAGFFSFILMVALAVLALFGLTLFRLAKGNAAVQKELDNLPKDPLQDFGSVPSLTVLPLVDYYTDNPELATEAGVSYLVRAGNTTILLDVGANAKKEHPSPLLRNMKTLGVSPKDIDMLFISHPHLDHLGGLAEQKSKTFSLSQGPAELREIPVYAPARLSPSAWNPGPKAEVVTGPRKLAEGVASLGVIPRNLYLMGYTPEHCLAVNVEGKGIVLVVGCGHPTIERILAQAKRIFTEPVYAVIGGLHFPVHGGRIMLGPVNVQALVGSDRPPWDGLGEKDVDAAVAALRGAGVELVALSPHDSSDWSLARFRHAFGGKCQSLKVGEEITV
jgi:7,8-dihydropterin-6-yl-methyl-4-(beta-D-ribofuranosyl)aminobenzene 5'-phosphate synthase